MSIRGGDGGLTPAFPPLLSHFVTAPDPVAVVRCTYLTHRKETMNHWNGKEEPLYYRPHSKLICALPVGEETPNIQYRIQDVAAFPHLFEICQEHPRTPKHLKGHS